MSGRCRLTGGSADDDRTTEWRRRGGPHELRFVHVPGFSSAREVIISADIALASLLLAEYEQLKEEQRARIAMRDNLLYVTLAAIAGVTAVIVGPTSGPGMYLLLPPVCVVLGWTYVVNDEKVSAIGTYVRTSLGPRLVELAGAAPGSAFAWETLHRSDRERRLRKTCQIAVDLLAFCVTGTVALALFWASDRTAVVLRIASALEFVAVLVLGIQIVRYSGLVRPHG